MGCLHIKHKIFSYHHQGRRDLLILDTEEQAPFPLCRPFARPQRGTCPGITMCLNTGGNVCNMGPHVAVSWHSGSGTVSFFSLQRWKHDPHWDWPSQSLGITLFSSFSLHPLKSKLQTPPSCNPPHTSPPHLSPLLWQVETLIIDFLFSLLSSVHSLQRLPTYLALTEQCCSRRALKDRLDCLGILISHFFLLHFSVYVFLFCAAFPTSMILFIHLYHLQS